MVLVARRSSLRKTGLARRTQIVCAKKIKYMRGVLTTGEEVDDRREVDNRRRIRRQETG
jgi:hypothetical protein